MSIVRAFAATALVLALGGIAEAQHIPVAVLFTPPILGGVGSVDCAIVNVSQAPLNVTIEFFDPAGNLLGSGVRTIGPGVIGGVTFGPHDGYCRFTVEGPKTAVRAAGRVLHPSFTVDVYPAE